MLQVKPTVLLADDHSGMLDKLSELMTHDFRVVGAVCDGAAAVEAVARLRPDVVVMDISMPVMDGLRATREIQKMGVDSKIIVLSALNDVAYEECAFESGASGYVVKTRMNVDLLFAVREVLAGRKFATVGRNPSIPQLANQLP
jgi:DNA-binding NarL/FixJ family response regulator